MSKVNDVSVSFDGSPEMQDTQRPTQAGQASSPCVIDTLKEFDQRGYSYAIRATVLPQFFSDGMVKAVKWLGCNLKCKEIRFEPVQPQGRGERFESQLDPDLFIEGFTKARKEGAKRGIAVDYSVCRSSRIRHAFCGAIGHSLNFLVTSTGIITTCNDVLTRAHEKAPMFHIGSVDPITGSIVINHEKVHWLRSLSVDKFVACETCFARWHCAGDCFARKKGPIDVKSPSIINHFRCSINRHLVLDDIFLLALQNDGDKLKRIIR